MWSSTTQSVVHRSAVTASPSSGSKFSWPNQTCPVKISPIRTRPFSGLFFKQAVLVVFLSRLSLRATGEEVSEQGEGGSGGLEGNKGHSKALWTLLTSFLSSSSNAYTL